MPRLRGRWVLGNGVIAWSFSSGDCVGSVWGVSSVNKRRGDGGRAGWSRWGWGKGLQVDGA